MWKKVAEEKPPVGVPVAVCRDRRHMRIAEYYRQKDVEAWYIRHWDDDARFAGYASLAEYPYWYPLPEFK